VVLAMPSRPPARPSASGAGRSSRGRQRTPRRPARPCRPRARPRPRSHYHAPLHIYYAESLQKYAGRCMNDFTARGYRGRKVGCRCRQVRVRLVPPRRRIARPPRRVSSPVHDALLPRLPLPPLRPPRRIHRRLLGAHLGLGRSVTLCYRTPTLYKIHEENRCLYFCSGSAAEPHAH
jgi:hypothetical protein